MELCKYFNSYRYRQKDESVLTVESTGALKPEQIILAGVDEVSNRLGEFKDMISQIKE